MAKRLAVLVAMLAMMMGMALPASAESEPQLTGVIEKPEVTSYMYGTHSMTDEVGGDLYALESEVVDLDAYVGQRVTVFGASVPGYENGQVEGGPPLFEVTRVEPARGPVDPVAATFELTVEGEVPAGGSSRALWARRAERPSMRRAWARSWTRTATGCTRSSASPSVAPSCRSSSTTLPLKARIPWSRTSAW